MNEPKTTVVKTDENKIPEMKEVSLAHEEKTGENESM